jgi:hypothetical protein
MRVLRGAMGTFVLMACHHAAVPLPDSLAPCFSPYPAPAAGTNRIDGPGAFGPHANDSLVVRVDSHDRWRGVLRSCQRSTPGLSIDVTPWQATGDTLEVTGIDLVSSVDRSKTWLAQLVTHRKAKG